ncbi:hypothetical protein [Amycolatopsis sp. cmx-4-54]|uniref:hypothetical protein n=1 Tax=Amycolatopsis sp. cmx-4-54 TaxID=2790936 RepID=UPI00397970AE
MSNNIFTRRTIATLFLGAITTGAALAAAGTALADAAPGHITQTQAGPASHLHGTGTTGTAPDGTRITFRTPDSREL